MSEDRHHYRNRSSTSLSPPPSSGSGSYPADPALSATDRRERNKAASAKYRAKKHHQSGEMRTQISVLQDHNNVVTRQLEECRAENALLKNQVEKLKGRLVAEKVLKRLREAGREKKRQGSGNGAGRHTTKVSAQDLTVSDSETDDVMKDVNDDDEDEDDVDDAILDDDDDDDDDDDEDFDIKIAKLQKEKKSNTRRKVARSGSDDQDLP
ncbi:hypothetical protein BGZ76_006521 [Entomortierella beljakovae]|nr:hypothetical protein BGZ76_006521 [Entomortierella beljakovae]